MGDGFLPCSRFFARAKRVRKSSKVKKHLPQEFHTIFYTTSDKKSYQSCDFEVRVVYKLFLEICIYRYYILLYCITECLKYHLKKKYKQAGKELAKDLAQKNKYITGHIAKVVNSMKSKPPKETDE